MLSLEIGIPFVKSFAFFYKMLHRFAHINVKSKNNTRFTEHLEFALCLMSHLKHNQFIN